MGALTLALANSIIEKGLEFRRSNGFKPLAIVVIDEGGHLKAVQREDGASMFRADVALGKAWASVAFDTPSRDLAERAKTKVPVFMTALAATSDGKFLAQTGGVLIKDKDGNIIGAAGASGDTGDNDERCCTIGIEETGLTADPSS